MRGLGGDCRAVGPTGLGGPAVRSDLWGGAMGVWPGAFFVRAGLPRATKMGLAPSNSSGRRRSRKAGYKAGLGNVGKEPPPLASVLMKYRRGYGRDTGYSGGGDEN